MRGRYALMLLTPPGLPVVRSYLTRQGTGGREGLRRGTDNGAIEKIPGTGTLRYSGTQQHHQLSKPHLQSREGRCQNGAERSITAWKLHIRPTGRQPSRKPPDCTS